MAKTRIDKDKQADSDRIRLKSLLMASSWSSWTIENYTARLDTQPFLMHLQNQF